MRKLFSSLTALAFVAGLGTAAVSADTMSKGDKMGAMTMSTKSCAKGETYVKGYKKKDGTMVKGYCRKGGAMSSMTKHM